LNSFFSLKLAKKIPSVGRWIFFSKIRVTEQFGLRTAGLNWSVFFDEIALTNEVVRYSCKMKNYVTVIKWKLKNFCPTCVFFAKNITQLFSAFPSKTLFLVLFCWSKIYCYYFKIYYTAPSFRIKLLLLLCLKRLFSLIRYENFHVLRTCSNSYF